MGAGRGSWGGCMKISFFPAFLVQCKLFIPSILRTGILAELQPQSPHTFLFSSLFNHVFVCFEYLPFLFYQSSSLFSIQVFTFLPALCGAFCNFFLSLFQPSILTQSISLGIIAYSDQRKPNMIIGLAAQTG